MSVVDRLVARRIELLPLDDLRYARYQRDLDDLWVRRIVTEFDPRIVRRPWISLRGELYWLVDGQHTVGALLELGYEEFECEILDDLTYEDEARLHESIQRMRKAPSVYASFNALAEAGDEEVVALRETVLRQGFEIVGRGGNTGRQIAAVRALWKVWKTTPRDTVEHALKRMRPWQSLDRTVPGYVLAGVCLFVRDADEYDDARLATILESNPPAAIELKSRDYGPQGLSSGSRAAAARNALADIYNKNLRDNKVTFVRGKR